MVVTAWRFLSSAVPIWLSCMFFLGRQKVNWRMLVVNWCRKRSWGQWLKHVWWRSVHYGCKQPLQLQTPACDVFIFMKFLMCSGNSWYLVVTFFSLGHFYSLSICCKSWLVQAGSELVQAHWGTTFCKWFAKQCAFGCITIERALHVKLMLVYSSIALCVSQRTVHVSVAEKNNNCTILGIWICRVNRVIRSLWYVLNFDLCTINHSKTTLVVTHRWVGKFI